MSTKTDRRWSFRQRNANQLPIVAGKHALLRKRRMAPQHHAVECLRGRFEHLPAADFLSPLGTEFGNEQVPRFEKRRVVDAINAAVAVTLPDGLGSDAGPELEELTLALPGTDVDQIAQDARRHDRGAVHRRLLDGPEGLAADGVQPIERF